MENLLELPFDEIATWFPKGLVSWMKRKHPDKWAELLSIEKELNEASFGMDEGKTNELLIKYRDFASFMAREFELRKGEGKERRKGNEDGESERCFIP